jgi:hypothetical protein
MKYSIITSGPNLMPAVWPATAQTEVELLAEAQEMKLSQLHLHPMMIIDWEARHVKRIATSLDPEGEAKIFDNAGELFGIATTIENFEEIARARDSEEQVNAN